MDRTVWIANTLKKHIVTDAARFPTDESIEEVIVPLLSRNEPYVAACVVAMHALMLFVRSGGTIAIHAPDGSGKPGSVIAVRRD